MSSNAASCGVHSVPPSPPRVNLFEKCEKLVESAEHISKIGNFEVFSNEILDKILEYVVALGISEKNYVKGQEKDTGGLARIRTGILRTNKQLYVQGCLVMFRTNLFHGHIKIMDYYAGKEMLPLDYFRFGVSRSSDDYDRLITPKSRCREFFDYHWSCLFTFKAVDQYLATAKLLRNIKFLLVTTSTFAEHRRDFFTGRPSNESISAVRSFISQCTKITHLQLYFTALHTGEQPDVCGARYDSALYYDFLEQLAIPLGAGKVTIHSRIVAEDFIVNLANQELAFTFSHDFHQHLKRSLLSPKGTQFPAFLGKNFITKVNYDDDWWSLVSRNL